jgi:hypothetical protein
MGIAAVDALVRREARETGVLALWRSARDVKPSKKAYI